MNWSYLKDAVKRFVSGYAQYIIVDRARPFRVSNYLFSAYSSMLNPAVAEAWIVKPKLHVIRCQPFGQVGRELDLQPRVCGFKPEST